MKNQLLTLVLLFGMSVFSQNTSDEKDGKFELQINSKLGFARLIKTDNVPLSGNVNGSDVMVAIKLSPRWNLASGVGFLQFDANQTVGGNTESIRNSYLQIPLRFTGDYNLFKGAEPKDAKIHFNIGLGVYANTLLNEEKVNTTTTTETKNLGWNFGIATAIGVRFVLTNALHIGVGLESQNDLTKMKKIEVERRMEQMNTVYLKFGLKF